MKKVLDSFVGKIINNEVRGILAQVDLVLDTLNEHHKIEPISIESFVSRFTEDTDRLIVEIKAFENLAFVGGHVVVRSLPDEMKSFHLGLDLYFTNAEGKIILKELARKLPCLLLDEKSIAELLNNSEIKFEVTDPSVS